MRTNIEQFDARLIEKLTRELGDARYKLGKEEGRRESLMQAVAFLQDRVADLEQRLEAQNGLLATTAAGRA